MHKKKYKNRHTINYRKTANVVINKKIKKKKIIYMHAHLCWQINYNFRNILNPTDPLVSSYCKCMIS